MRVNICLGGVKICLECERKIKTDEAFAPFIRQNDSKMQPDLYAAVSWKWEEPPLASGDKMGEDLIQTYYRVDEKISVWYGRGKKVRFPVQNTMIYFLISHAEYRKICFR